MSGPGSALTDTVCMFGGLTLTATVLPLVPGGPTLRYPGGSIDATLLNKRRVRSVSPYVVLQNVSIAYPDIVYDAH